MAASLHQHSHSHGGGGGDDDGHGHGHSHGGGGSGHGHGHGHGHAAHDDETHLVESGDTEPDTEPGHGHAAQNKVNINVRAAFIHVIGDFIQSIGVLIAALIIYYKPEYKIADPICTFLFSILVLCTTFSILRDTMHVLMEGAPKNLNFNKVKQALFDIPGVVEVHNLRLWSLTTTKSAVSVHLAFDANQDPQVILKQANKLLRHQFMVYDATIQMEAYVPQMADCVACRDPKD